ncbi:hypothetical protein [Bacillus cihuensis]|uniref:hypothetical protein n=1 Tax=Bacillus cihuensis TaxID=1208599 RepID=UPI0012697CDD|nr:hypothetical protein [Bacillus cihuensis]
MIHQGRLKEDSLMVMKIVGDAICANENQLRRYLSKRQSASKTSSTLKSLRKYGFVERHKSHLAFEEDDEISYKPPAPFTLGIGGYKLMNHLYPEHSFTQPEQWSKNSLAIQRYVAMNEMRCLSVEAGVLRGWSWNPYIGGSAKYRSPLAVAKLESPQGEIQLLMERPQMAQNFIGYYRTKLEVYRYLYERDKYFKIDGFSKANLQIVCLYVSSSSMAKFIQEEIRLHTFPFDIWLLSNEWISEEKGMSEAFCTVNQDGLKRIRIPFLAPKQM